MGSPQSGSTQGIFGVRGGPQVLTRSEDARIDLYLLGTPHHARDGGLFAATPEITPFFNYLGHGGGEESSL